MGVAVWAVGQGATWLAFIPAFALGAALVVWKQPYGMSATFTAAAVTVIAALLLLGDVWLYFLPSALIASMAAALRLAVPVRRVTP
ncbi:hypothetical protein BJN44_01125 [Tessaracoccus sp. ZS01]|nr:hypothetical protein BJN44_01125 [Tessaracoccus sp. ZS01]